MPHDASIKMPGSWQDDLRTVPCPNIPGDVPLGIEILVVPLGIETLVKKPWKAKNFYSLQAPLNIPLFIFLTSKPENTYSIILVK